MIYKNKEGEIINVSFQKRRSKFIIPEFLGNYQCISIGPEEFTTWEGLTEVVIPNSVTSIGAWTFSGCHNLTNVDIPKNLTKIGPQAFAGCNKLTSITIPESVTAIGEKAFYECTNLDVGIDNSKDNIKVGKNAFKNCKSVIWLKTDKPKHSHFEYIYCRGTEPIWEVGNKLAYYEFCTDHEGVYDLGTITNVELDKEFDDWVYTFEDSNQEFEEELLKSEAYKCKK